MAGLCVMEKLQMVRVMYYIGGSKHKERILETIPIEEAIPENLCRMRKSSPQVYHGRCMGK